MTKATSFDRQTITERLQGLMGEKRLRHTIGVAASARELAARYGENPDRAELAGLLHDCAKELKLKDMQALVDEASTGTKVDVQVDDEMYRSGNLLHGTAGALLAERDFGVTDAGVLEAIRVHTTGKAGMSALDKIVFLADYIEPGRTFPGVDALREAAEKDPDEAVLAGFETTIGFLRDKDTPIYAPTLAAYEDMKEYLRRRHEDA